MSAADDTLAEIRALFLNNHRLTIGQLRPLLQTARIPHELVEDMLEVLERGLAARLERELPMILRDMQITAGETRLQ